jgi:hypothetical protein
MMCFDSSTGTACVDSSWTRTSPVSDRQNQQKQDLEIQANAGIYDEDFDLLDRFMAEFKTLITTPHVLTEVSNLGDLNGPEREVFSSWFVRTVESLASIALRAGRR